MLGLDAYMVILSSIWSSLLEKLGCDKQTAVRIQFMYVCMCSGVKGPTSIDLPKLTVTGDFAGPIHESTPT